MPGVGVGSLVCNQTHLLHQVKPSEGLIHLTIIQLLTCVCLLFSPFRHALGTIVARTIFPYTQFQHFLSTVLYYCRLVFALVNFCDGLVVQQHDPYLRATTFGPHTARTTRDDFLIEVYDPK